MEAGALVAVVAVVAACSSAARSTSRLASEAPADAAVAWAQDSAIFVASVSQPTPHRIEVQGLDMQNDDVRMMWSASGERLVVNYGPMGGPTQSTVVDRRTWNTVSLPPGHDWDFIGEVPAALSPGGLIESSDYRSTTTVKFRYAGPRGPLNEIPLSEGVSRNAVWIVTTAGLFTVTVSGQVTSAPAPSFVKVGGSYPASLSPDAKTLAIANIASAATELFLQDTTTGRLTPITLPPAPSGKPWKLIDPHYDESGTLLVNLGEDQFRLQGSQLVSTGRSVEASTADGEIAVRLLGSGDGSESIAVNGQEVVRVTGDAPLPYAISGFGVRLA